MRAWVLILALLITESAFAQPAPPPPCEPAGLTPNSYLRSTNIVYLRLLEGTFPESFVNPYDPSTVTDGIRDSIRDALARAALSWNSACGQAPILNDQPILLPANQNFTLPTGTQNALFVNVNYLEGASPDTKPCRYFPAERCHDAVGRTTISNNEITITVFSKFGRSTGLRWTLHDYAGVYKRIFLHEFGHILLLDHDICHRSPMLEDISDQWSCIPGDPSCEPRPRTEHCDQMALSFEPADPLERVLTENPDSLCRLNLYCVPYNGGMSPWAKIRSGCVWFQDVAQTFVDTYDEDGNHIGGAVRSYTSFSCYGGIFNFNSRGGDPSSPFLMVGLPKPGAVASGGLLKLAGWTWGRHHIFVSYESSSIERMLPSPISPFRNRVERSAAQDSTPNFAILTVDSVAGSISRRFLPARTSC